MERRGRPKKPLELLKLLGNPGKRPLPTDTPQPKKLYDIPAPPAHLDVIGKEIWEYLASRLTKCGILTEIDIYTLENCCVALSIAKKAAKELQESPLVYSTKNKDGSNKSVHKTQYLTVWREALAEFDNNGAKLGLSPSERAKMHVNYDANKNKEQEFFQTKTK